MLRQKLALIPFQQRLINRIAGSGDAVQFDQVYVSFYKVKEILFVKKGIYNRVFVFLMAGLLSIVLFLSMQGSALASPRAQTRVQPLTATCSGNGCNNTDPYATGCVGNKGNDFVTYISTAYGGDGDAVVWLMYSPTCGTNWAELHTATDDHVEYLYGQINRASGVDGGALSFHYSSSQYTWINTNQVYAPHNAAQACGASINSSVVCTNYF